MAMYVLALSPGVESGTEAEEVVTVPEAAVETDPFGYFEPELHLQLVAVEYEL